MADIRFTNSPTKLSLNDFKSKLDEYGSVSKQCRFMVQISFQGQNNILNSSLDSRMLNDLIYLCDATELPGRSTDIIENRYYGPSFNVPRNAKYSGVIDLSIICRSEGFERQFFDDWLNVINPVTNFNFEYRENYISKIDVYQFAEYAKDKDSTFPKPVYQWTLHEAWPVQVTDQKVTWADDDIQRLSVSFTYRYWSRPGRDGIQ